MYLYGNFKNVKKLDSSYIAGRITSGITTLEKQFGNSLKDKQARRW
jgi:hypothetical protein